MSVRPVGQGRATHPSHQYAVLPQRSSTHGKRAERLAIPINLASRVPCNVTHQTILGRGQCFPGVLHDSAYESGRDLFLVRSTIIRSLFHSVCAYHATESGP